MFDSSSRKHRLHWVFTAESSLFTVGKTYVSVAIEFFCFKLLLPASFTLHDILTGSVNMVRTCEASASTARELKAAPFSSEYQKLLLGSSITKFTTNSAYSTRSQVIVAHTIPQLSWMNHSVRFPAACPMWALPTMTPAARLPLSTSAPADSSGWCCSISRSRWFEDCILSWVERKKKGKECLFTKRTVIFNYNLFFFYTHALFETIIMSCLRNGA